MVGSVDTMQMKTQQAISGISVATRKQVLTFNVGILAVVPEGHPLDGGVAGEVVPASKFGDEAIDCHTPDLS